MTIKIQVRARICFAMLAIVVAGCGSNYPPVSGQVTIDGQPVADVVVLFNPVSTREKPFPGPYAEGVTDQEGKFSLVTRDGSAGAAPGLNKVEFYSGGTIELEFMRSELAQLKMTTAGDANHPAYQQFKQLKGKIESLERLEKTTPLEPGFRVEFTVPPEGTDTADFELTKLEASE